ncbi:MAG: hypothetical protein U1F66_00090 [bacterium]
MTPNSLHRASRSVQASQGSETHTRYSGKKAKPERHVVAPQVRVAEAAVSLLSRTAAPLRLFGFSSLWKDGTQLDRDHLEAMLDPEHAKLELLEARFEAGHREPALLEALARRCAEAGRFQKAVELGLQRRLLGFATPEAKIAFDLEVGAWAEQNDDLLLAKWIYLREHDPEMIYYQQSCFVKMPYLDAYIRLHEDPRRWVAAARRKLAAGDFLAAESLLKSAERMNDYTVYRRREVKPHWNPIVVSYPASLGSLKNERAADGSWNLEPTKLTADKDPKIAAEIETLRAELHSFETGLAERVQAEGETLQAQIEKGGAAQQAKAEARQGEWTALQTSLSELDHLASGQEWDVAADRLKNIADFLEVGQWDAVDSLFMDLAGPVQKILPWEPEDADKRKVFQGQATAFLSVLAEALPAVESRDAASLKLKVAALRAALATWRETAEGGIQHLQVSTLLRKARLHLAAGYFYGRADLAMEGRRELAALQRYAQIELRKNAAFQDLARLYPEGTGLIFRSELGEEDKKTGVYDMRPSPKVVENSRILKTLQRLETDDPALTALMKEVLEDCKAGAHLRDQREVEPETGFTYELGYEVTGYSEKDELGRDAAALEVRTRELERLYGNDDAEIVRFIKAIQKDEHDELYEKNMGYRYQRDLEVNLARLKDFAINEAAFQAARENEYQGIDAEMAKALVAFLQNSGKLYEKYLEEQVAKAREQETLHSVDGWHAGASLLAYGYGMVKYEFARKAGAPETYLEEVRLAMLSETEKAQRRLDEFRDQFKKVQGDLASIDFNDLPGTFATLERISAEEQAWEEAHTLGILKWEMAEVEKISSSATSRMKPLAEKLETTDPWSGKGQLSSEERRQSYLRLQQRVEFEVLRAELCARISAYDSMGDEADLYDDIWNGLGHAVEWVASPVTDLDWEEFKSTGNFDMVKRKYRELRDILDRDDLAAVESVRPRYQRLNAMAIHDELQDEYEDLALSNRLSLGLAATPFAAVGGALFAEGAAVLGAGRIGMGFANALGFTLTARVLHGAAYHGFPGVGKAFTDIGSDPFGFSEEVLFNWAMFGVLGKVNQAFSKFFEGRVEGVIASRLVARGRLASGTVITEELLAKDAALKAAYLEESAAVNGFRTEILRRGGAFAVEAGTFQGWDFLMGNYQLAKIGRFDPKLAAKKAFSLEAWVHGLAFLGALKMGNTMALGVPGFARLQLWLGARMQARLESQADAKNDAIPRFSTGSSLVTAPAFSGGGQP